MEPGIYDGVEMHLYQADQCPTPSLSKGMLQRLLTKTPAHAYRVHPRLGNMPEDKDDDGKLDYGSAAHAMLFEKGLNIVTVAADDWRTKAAREARDAARAEHKFPILERQHEKVATMAGRARKFINDSILGGVFEDGACEQSLYWVEEGKDSTQTYTWCRARTDLKTNDHSIIVDYKTTKLPNPAAFCRAMPAMGYDLQEVFYRRGVRKLTGVEADFYFLVQELSEPFSCYLVQCAPSMREVAESKVKRGMELWRACLGSNNWPAYGPNVYHAEAPAWAVMEEEEAS